MDLCFREMCFQGSWDENVRSVEGSGNSTLSITPNPCIIKSRVFPGTVNISWNYPRPGNSCSFRSANGRFTLKALRITGEALVIQSVQMMNIKCKGSLSGMDV